MRFKSILILFVLFISSVVSGQIHNPVLWSTEVNNINDDTYQLVSTATIEDGWHLYGQHIDKDGPIPTTFYYPKEIQLIGETQEEEGTVVDDEIFEMKIKYFEGVVKFTQKIKKTDLQKIKASVEFMVCNDSNCLPPEEVDLLFDVTKAKQIENLNKKEDKGMFVLFLLSFLAGLSALFTPCVFPMIPMTVSFFTKQSKNRVVGIKNAFLYGVSIIVIYLLLGTAVVGVFGADALNQLSTSVIFNIVFFIILIVFAASFLGAFELVLPSSWGTKLDEKADKGGFIGIFFMAMALAVVSFSCTGPIVGTALVESAAHGGIGPVVSMFGFSLAIALPFTLFAIFPGWMNSLPKSGGWLNTVKVVLGFLELALAFKFLSNADLVLQAHWLEREVFIAIWMAIFLGLAFYLFGKIRLPHDYQAVEKIAVSRLFLGLTSLVFVIYMLPGLFGAPLKLISAFVPPLSYSESPMGLGKSSNVIVSRQADNLPDGAELFVPYNFIHFKNYEKGLAYAKSVNKPVLLDFTGHACVNCRKMEQNVWSSPKVLDVLTNKVVLISLYVDDRRSLENEEVSPFTGKPYKYIGQKWSEFQVQRYKTNAQPFYVLIDQDGKDLNTPVGYTPNVDEYLTFLNEGL